MTNFFRTLLTFALLMFFALPSTAQVQELLVNGNFETDPFPAGEHGRAVVTGWSSMRVLGAGGEQKRSKLVRQDPSIICPLQKGEPG